MGPAIGLLLPRRPPLVNKPRPLNSKSPPRSRPRPLIQPEQPDSRYSNPVLNSFTLNSLLSQEQPAIAAGGEDDDPGNLIIDPAALPAHDAPPGDEPPAPPGPTGEAKEISTRAHPNLGDPTVEIMDVDAPEPQCIAAWPIGEGPEGVQLGGHGYEKLLDVDPEATDDVVRDPNYMVPLDPDYDPYQFDSDSGESAIVDSDEADDAQDPDAVRPLIRPRLRRKDKDTADLDAPGDMELSVQDKEKHRGEKRKPGRDTEESDEVDSDEGEDDGDDDGDPFVDLDDPDVSLLTTFPLHCHYAM